MTRLGWDVTVMTLACIILVFYWSWTSCIEDWLQLVATDVVDQHGPVLTVSVWLPQHLANKKTSPVQLSSKFDEKTRPDQTFKLYLQGSSHHCCQCFGTFLPSLDVATWSPACSGKFSLQVPVSMCSNNL